MEEEQRFYQELYTSKVDSQSTRKIQITRYLSGLQHPTLDESEQKEIAREITEDEIWGSICQSADNKSPGNDGFTLEFYKKIWPEIKLLLLKSYKHSFEHVHW